MAVKPVLVMAPIRGVTDAVYRDAWARSFGGFARAVAPFIQLRQGQPLRPGELRQVSPANNSSLITVPQVLTHHALTFAAALRELHAAGHTEVNWNLGCPYPMVAKRGRGAGLLPHPDRLDAILAQVLADAPVRLSVKLRLGYRDPDEVLAVLAVLNRYPLTEVILHPRTATQMYGGAVDLARAAQALAVCRHPFTYNGDITSLEGLNERRRQLPGAAAWMVGRGALAWPFLPALLQGEVLPSAETRRQRLREFHDRLVAGYAEWLSGPRHRLDKLKEQWGYLALAFADPRQALTRIQRSDTLNAYEDAVAWAFDQALRSDPTDGTAQRR